MSKQKIHALDYIRGISMLGVVGIHTGSYSLSNPTVNVHLFALLEIVSRFSVPIFFFVSAFGLFLHQDITSKLNYLQFITRRSRAVLVPYLVWSLFYMIHYTFISKDFSIWHPPLVYEYFLFGLASCQLYFLVILLWFYALMPLWRFLVRHIITHPLRNLGILLLLQIIFNYYSSYALLGTALCFYFPLWRGMCCKIFQFSTSFRALSRANQNLLLCNVNRHAKLLLLFIIYLTLLTRAGR